MARLGDRLRHAVNLAHAQVMSMQAEHSSRPDRQQARRSTACRWRGVVAAVMLVALASAAMLAAASPAHGPVDAGRTSQGVSDPAPRGETVEREHRATVDAPKVAQAGAPRKANAPVRRARADRSGLRRVGMASYYANRFAGRLMADGTPMRPESDNAASTTLPLGTVARVTNLKNGRSTLVTIRDRGPYAKGRIIDLSPRTARLLGFVQAGVTKVEVVPVQLPGSERGSPAATLTVADAS